MGVSEVCSPAALGLLSARFTCLARYVLDISVELVFTNVYMLAEQHQSTLET
jgi:hypothetical protein